MTGDTAWDTGGVDATGEGSRNADDIETADESQEEDWWDDDAAADSESSEAANIEDAAASWAQSGESSEWKSGVSTRAVDDEGTGETEDGVGVDGGTSNVGRGNQVQRVALDGLVQALSSKDSTSGTQKLLVGDERSSTEVGGNTNALKDGGEPNERANICEWEVVAAGSHWADTETSQGSLQEHNVGLLITSDESHLVEEACSEATTDEIRLGKAGETLLVEHIFKVLKLLRLLVADVKRPHRKEELTVKAN